jgi:hypothetical protein
MPQTRKSKKVSSAWRALGQVVADEESGAGKYQSEDSGTQQKQQKV